MSSIGKNIKKIRTVKNLSQAAFAQLFDLARPSVGAYEEGRSEPKIDTLVQIARHFGISLDLLITKELTVNDLYGFDIFKPDLQAEQLLIKVAGAAESPAHRTALVMANEQPGYFTLRQERQYIDGLPSLILPGKTDVLHRAFEHTGSEMQYQQHGLRHGDILYCSFVPPEASQLKPNEVYTLVTPTKLTTRRFQGLTQEGALLLKADNPDYDHLTYAVTEVTEIWHVDGVYSTYLKSPSSLEERLTRLETLVRKLSGEQEND
ncbi:helix-turn-helix domain-containing protein [Rufibacter tibetensis]|uniref:helix-turn-helix domain-containing protein n=1 Tax=Rufibacter tibetensis TaxID=512763 RepID=UPI0007864753|nr:helix-turn-helix domain-containing protein [Rufibacter tibetensis]